MIETKHLTPAAIAISVIATGLSCARQPEPAPVYAPTQLGLTLLFENPQLGREERAKNRYQIEVIKTEQAEDGSSGLNVTTSTASIQWASENRFFCSQSGEVRMIAPDGTRSVSVLPSGFPFKTQSWQSEGLSYRVLGRAYAKLPGVSFRDPVGVWVEASPGSPQRPNPNASFELAHIFLMPGIGEVETRVFSNGAWSTTNRLVGKGHTDDY